ncbi:MAG: nucleotidyl transferase AbiEii/AbiGii toxin family protein [Candidatus Sabulitectum sp.]|nr:nucleotidyl transferase AbiEii/AbiGii toxin family protein [Candidatus Sabulitectum sp.]
MKIEPNYVMRGSVFNVEEMNLCTTAQEYFKVFVKTRSLSIADVYAGKLCAALDRQHPRDLFDVKLLQEGTGISSEIRRAFVVYLACHNRPISELLNPSLLDIEKLYDNQFNGMTRTEIALDELTHIQRNLAPNLLSALDSREREFLISMKLGEPDWELLGIDHIRQLPGLQWKLLNIRRMNEKKRLISVLKLKRILDY